jgi:hypothetical protein
MSKWEVYRLSGLAWPIFLLWQVILLATASQLAPDTFLARKQFGGIFVQHRGNPVGQIM